MAREPDLEFNINVKATGLSELQQTTKAVKRVEDRMKAGARSVNQYAAAHNKSGRSVQKFSMGVLQQAGYQIGDYAVQVANGTSKMQAFGQQGAQLLGVFGPIGAVLGAGVAIFSAVAVAIQKTSEATDSAKKSVDLYIETLKKLEDQYRQTDLEQEMFERGLGDIDETVLVKGIERAKEELEKAQAAVDALPAKGSQAALTNTFAIADAYKRVEDALKGVADAEKALEEFEEDRRKRRQREREGLPRTQIMLAQVNYAKQQHRIEQSQFQTATERTRVMRAMTAYQKEQFETEKAANDELKRTGIERALTIQNENKILQARLKFSEDATRLEGALLEYRLDALANELYTLGVSKPIREEIISLTRRQSELQRDVAEETERASRAERLRERLLSNSVNRALALRDSLSQAAQATLTSEQQAAVLRAQISAAQQGRSIAAAEAATRTAQALKDSGASLDQIAIAAQNAGASAAEVERLQEQLKAIKDPAEAASAAINSMNEAAQPAFNEMQDRAEQLASSISGSFESAFMSMVDGTQSAKEAFRSLSRDIISELYRVFIVKRITGFIGDFVSDPAMFGGGSGPIGSVRPNARSFDGGGYTGNGARAGGLDGRGGFMAMIHPRETVVDHTKGQGQGVTIVQNNNFGDGVSRSEVQQMIPAIVQATKAAVFDAQRRSVNGRGYA